jgi:hypothetical protein
MSGTINLGKHFKRQGIDPHSRHEATVVNNRDPRKLGRIQARIKGLFDGIEDEHLPWAIPTFGHVDGALGGDTDKRSGIFYVPKIGTKVLLSFPEGDAHHPRYSGYTVDEKTFLKEAEPNYPDRAVLKFSNGFYIIVDTKTNEVFICNPGDINVTILGDVNQQILGNQQLVVTDTKGHIPGYLLNAPETVLKNLSPKPAKQIPFDGLLSKSEAGNQHTHVKGDHTILIEGNHKMIVKQDLMVEVHGTYFQTVKGNAAFDYQQDASIQSKGSVTTKAQKFAIGANRIDLN